MFFEVILTLEIALGVLCGSFVDFVLKIASTSVSSNIREM